MPTPGIGLSWSVASSSVIEPDLIQASTFPQPAICLSPAGPIFSFMCWVLIGSSQSRWFHSSCLWGLDMWPNSGQWDTRRKSIWNASEEDFSFSKDISYTSGYCAWNHSNHLLTSPRLTTAPRIARQKAGKNLGPWWCHWTANWLLLEPAYLVISCYVRLLKPLWVRFSANGFLPLLVSPKKPSVFSSPGWRVP